MESCESEESIYCLVKLFIRFLLPRFSFVLLTGTLGGVDCSFGAGKSEMLNTEQILEYTVKIYVHSQIIW